MKSLLFLLVAFLFAGAASAQPDPAAQILADRETEALSARDRLAAAKAEQEALDRDQPIQSMEWEGPDGARGFIIVGSEFPNHFAMGRCRDFIHIIRHPRDGGVNPTFRATVCRDWEGKWRTRSTL